jgi:hypothetical protein
LYLGLPKKFDIYVFMHCVPETSMRPGAAPSAHHFQDNQK